jgi:UPF0716 protein FxsA
MRILLAVLLLGLPLAEIFVLILVGNAIGAVATLALVVLAGVLGVWILRRQGLASGRRFRAALEAGELPVAAAFDSACVFLAGILLIVPGFITDLVALVLLLPWVRALLRGGLAALLAGKIATHVEVRKRTIEGEFHEVDGTLPPGERKPPE